MPVKRVIGLAALAACLTLLGCARTLTFERWSTLHNGVSPDAVEATLGERQTQKQLMDHLVDRAFDGSAVRLALRALSSRPSSREELAEIRELIERFKEREGDEE